MARLQSCLYVFPGNIRIRVQTDPELRQLRPSLLREVHHFQAVDPAPLHTGQRKVSRVGRRRDLDDLNRDRRRLAAFAVHGFRANAARPSGVLLGWSKAR